VDALDRAWAVRDPGLIYLQVDPAFRPYLAHARVERILNDMRLPRP
jgi:hypothetical protein